MDRSNNNNSKNLDSTYQCYKASCCTSHRPTYFSWLLNRGHTNKQTNKNRLLTKNVEEFSGKIRRIGQQADKKKKSKTEIETELYRITRDVLVNWNQMTALKFETGGGGGGYGGRHQTSPASLLGL